MLKTGELFNISAVLLHVQSNIAIELFGSTRTVLYSEYLLWRGFNELDLRASGVQKPFVMLKVRYDVSFYNSTMVVGTLATPRTTWESIVMARLMCSSSNTMYLFTVPHPQGHWQLQGLLGDYGEINV